MHMKTVQALIRCHIVSIQKKDSSGYSGDWIHLLDSFAVNNKQGHFCDYVEFAL